LGTLVQYAALFAKDFETVTREDVERVIGSLLQHKPAYSPATLATYRAIIKRFLTWVAHPEDFTSDTPAPPSVAWLRSNVRKRDQRPLQRSELLTPEEIERVIAACLNP